MLFFFAYNKTILSTATAIVRTKKNNFPTEYSLVRGIGNFTTRQVLSFTLFNFASLAMSQYKAMNTSLSRFSLMCVLKWRLKTLFASILNHYMCVCVYCLVWESSRRSINDAIVEEAGEVQREDFPSERDGKNQYFYAQRVFLNYYPANTFFCDQAASLWTRRLLALAIMCINNKIKCGCVWKWNCRCTENDVNVCVCDWSINKQQETTAHGVSKSECTTATVHANRMNECRRRVGWLSKWRRCCDVASPCTHLKGRRRRRQGGVSVIYVCLCIWL